VTEPDTRQTEGAKEMTRDSVDWRRFHLSIGRLMIAVAACAVLLAPVGEWARERALRKAWLMRAHAARLRAIALEQRYRQAEWARVRAEHRGAGAAVSPSGEAPVPVDTEWQSP
jgi:hypothetical protein